MPPWMSCNLSMINLAKFVGEGNEFNWAGLFKTAYDLCGLMNNMLDVMDFPDQRFKDQTLKYRPIGIGPAGLSDAMFLMDLKYNGRDGRDFAEEAMRIITHGAIRRSIELAKDKGPIHNYAIFKDDILRIVKGLIEKEGDNSVDETIEMLNNYGIYNSVHTVCAPTGCLKDNSLVATNKGILKFNEIMNVENERWCDVNDDYSVLQENNEYSNIDGGFINGFVSTKKIIMKSGVIIESTPNHKFRVVDGDEYLWRSAENLKPGDMLPYKIGGYSKEDNFKLKSIDISPEIYKFPYLAKEISLPDEMNEDLSYFMGLYLADGSTHERSIRISLHSEDVNIINKAADNIKRTFGVVPTWNKDKRENAGSLTINSILLIDWLRKNNLLKNKTASLTIPKAIRASSIGSIKAFIEGYIDGDGHRGKHKNISSISHDMIQELAIISRFVGYNCRIETINNREGAYSINPVYRLTFLKYGSANECVINPKKELKVEVDKIHQIIGDCSMIPDYVVEIKNSEALTLDAHVPRNNYYIANSYISHNTTALSCDCSYGIEPCFGLVFEKNLMTGDRMKVVNPIFEKRFRSEPWYSTDIIERIFANSGSLKNVRGVPKEVKDVFVVAHDIKPRDRVEIQSVIQKRVSLAISSTINLPSSATSTDISEIYKQAYASGLKGITVYRDGCKQNQPVVFRQDASGVVSVFERPSSLPSVKHCIEMVEGKLYVDVVKHNDKIVELWLDYGKSGQDINGLLEALGKSLSTGFQHGVPKEAYIKQFKGIKGEYSSWFRFDPDDKKPVQLFSIPDAVAKLIERFYTKNGEVDTDGRYNVCPKCHNNSLINIEGCATCQQCGYSKCS